MSTIDVNISSQLDSDYTGLNNLAIGLADPNCQSVMLPNLSNLGGGNLTINPHDGGGSMGPGALFAVSQSASNTENNDQILNLVPTKQDGITKSAVRDAKS